MASWIEAVAQAPAFILLSGTASILSLMIVGYVAFRLRAIQRVIFSIVRVPQSRNELRKRASELAGLLKDYDGNRVAIRELLVRSRPVVVNLQGKLRGTEKRGARVLGRTVRRYLGRRRFFVGHYFRRDAETEQNCREIYEMMIELVETLDQHVADESVRIRHVG